MTHRRTSHTLGTLIELAILLAVGGFVLWILLGTAAGQEETAEGPKPEAYYRDDLARVLGGTTEHVLEDGTRVDVLTPAVAFEVDFPERLFNGGAQALWYGKRTDRQPGLYLIVRKNSDEAWIERARVFCREEGILLFVRDVRPKP